MNAKEFLLGLCDEIYLAEQVAEAERKREAFGNNPPFELVVARKDKVLVEIHKENVSHHHPHIHISHSDKFDVSISLRDFSILAGDIDGRTIKKILKLLQPKQKQLNEIWNELHNKDNPFGVEKMISNLGLKN